MIFVLPPAENKTEVTTGPSLNLQELYLAKELTPAREQVMKELERISRTPQANKILQVGPKAAQEITANLHLKTAPGAPAFQLFDGVLAKAADIRHFSSAHLQHVLIMSALFGIVRANDLIVPHRISMKVSLGELGPISKFWLPYLTSAMNNWLTETVDNTLRKPPPNRSSKENNKPLILDVRSQEYRKAWPLPPNVIGVTVEARIRQKDGTLKVVSHNAKRARGLLVGQLMRMLGEDGLKDPASNSMAGLEKLLRELSSKGEGWNDFILEEPQKSGDAWQLLLIQE